MRLLWLPLTLLLAACNNGDGIALGTLEQERIELVAEVAEPIVELPLAEGSMVKAGDLLVRFDDARLAAQQTASNAAAAQVEARLAEVRRGPRRERITALAAQLTGAEQSAKEKQQRLTRLQTMAGKGFASSDALDQAAAAAAAAIAARDALAAQLREAKNGASPEELAQATQAVEAARAGAETASLNRNKSRLLAPIGGRLDSLNFDVGERPSVGAVVAVLLAGPIYARVYVPEAVRAAIQPGSPATIRVEGVDAPLAGKVRKIGRDPLFTPYYALTEHDRGRLAWLAEIELTGDTSKLPVGLPVEVEFGEKR